MEKIGFIGMGNMAQALCAGFIKSGKAPQIEAFAPNQEKLKANAENFGFTPRASITELVDSCGIIIMACKPYQIVSVLSQVRSNLAGKALVSVAAGWGFAKYETFVEKSTRVQFVMPNTPAMVGAGVMLFEKTNSLREDERKELMDLFSSVGIVEELEDSLMGIGGAVAGCGPAFVDLFIEAYADAAVKYGISRTTAYKLVSQTLLGSAKLQLQTGTHPAMLKDAVCSPGGTTIRGVSALEKAGFRDACISSIDAIMEKKLADK